MIRSATAVAALCSLALLVAGCGRPGQGSLSVYPSGDPLLSMSGVREGVWSSAPWAADGVSWIPFRPHEQVQVEHTLGYAPTSVLTYISFVEGGETPSLAAGDLTRIVDVDASTVTVWNDTNGTYFVRVVAF